MPTKRTALCSRARFWGHLKVLNRSPRKMLPPIGITLNKQREEAMHAIETSTASHSIIPAVGRLLEGEMGSAATRPSRETNPEHHLTAAALLSDNLMKLANLRLHFFGDGAGGWFQSRYAFKHRPRLARYEPKQRQTQKDDKFRYALLHDVLLRQKEISGSHLLTVSDLFQSSNLKVAVEKGKQEITVRTSDVPLHFALTTVCITIEIHCEGCQYFLIPPQAGVQFVTSFQGLRLNVWPPPSHSLNANP